jgi:hypothetical protein
MMMSHETPSPTLRKNLLKSDKSCQKKKVLVMVKKSSLRNSLENNDRQETVWLLQNDSGGREPMEPGRK